MRCVGRHHPQRVAPAEHIEVDVQRGLLAAVVDVGLGAEQAVLLEIPEGDADPMMLQRAQPESLGKGDDHCAPRRIVGGAVAGLDLVRMRAKQQQGRGTRPRDFRSQVDAVALPLTNGVCVTGIFNAASRCTIASRRPVFSSADEITTTSAIHCVAVPDSDKGLTVEPRLHPAKVSVARNVSR